MGWVRESRVWQIKASDPNMQDLLEGRAWQQTMVSDLIMERLLEGRARQIKIKGHSTGCLLEGQVKRWMRV